MSYCKKCGVEIEEGKEYCEECEPQEETQEEIEEVQAEVIEEATLEDAPKEEAEEKQPRVIGTFSKIAVGLAIGATVLFILGQILSFIPIISYVSFLFSTPAFPLAVASLVFGIVAFVKKEKALGLILGIVALAFQIVVGIITFAIGFIIGIVIAIMAIIAEQQ